MYIDGDNNIYKNNFNLDFQSIVLRKQATAIFIKGHMFIYPTLKHNTSYPINVNFWMSWLRFQLQTLGKWCKVQVFCVCIHINRVMKTMVKTNCLRVFVNIWFGKCMATSVSSNLKCRGLIILRSYLAEQIFWRVQDVDLSNMY